jgi:hypothetical protein
LWDFPSFVFRVMSSLSTSCSICPFCIQRLWHDCWSSSSFGNRTWTQCKSIDVNDLPSDRNYGFHISLLCCKVGRQKISDKFSCETIIVCSRFNILPNHGIVWEAI